jgi:hypothetical protein
MFNNTNLKQGICNLEIMLYKNKSPLRAYYTVSFEVKQYLYPKYILCFSGSITRTFHRTLPGAILLQSANKSSHFCKHRYCCPNIRKYLFLAGQNNKRSPENVKKLWDCSKICLVINKLCRKENCSCSNLSIHRILRM